MLSMCDLCFDRLAEGKKPICVEAYPMRALDAGPLPELRTRYGEVKEAVGFAYSAKLEPAVTFRPKVKTL
jgi:anaerobic dimethyl sulfoxide reductase subunit B (iron-sulfur subunit)